MTRIIGGNNPGNAANVDNEGRLYAKAVASTEQAYESALGNAFNINTDDLTLTTDDETPVLYIYNDEDNPLLIPRLFFAFMTSTGGSGPVRARVVANPTGGTLLSGADLTKTNFNFGSGRQVSITAKKGGTGVTIAGASDTSFRFLYPSTGMRDLLAFEAIVLPRGGAMAILVTPPTGNTSMLMQCGVNAFLQAPLVS